MPKVSKSELEAKILKELKANPEYRWAWTCALEEGRQLTLSQLKIAVHDFVNSFEVHLPTDGATQEAVMVVLATHYPRCLTARCAASLTKPKRVASAKDPLREWLQMFPEGAVLASAYDCNLKTYHAVFPHLKRQALRGLALSMALVAHSGAYLSAETPRAPKEAALAMMDLADQANRLKE